MPMNLFVRPYNVEARILEAAFEKGLTVDGIMVDASIAAYFGGPTERMRQLATTQKIAFLIDPVTHKIRSPHFRQKASYQRLPYYQGAIPTLRRLAERAEEITQQVLVVETDQGATNLVSPYMYVPPIGAEAYTQVNQAWAEQFSRQTEGVEPDPYWSVCFHVDGAGIPETREAILAQIVGKGVKRIYLLLTDWEIGENEVVDRAICAFLGEVRGAGVEEIIYSHAPFWVYCLEPRGITGFVTGVNYLATLKEAYLVRTEEIGGITHNYYIPRRFVKMAPEAAERAVSDGLVDPCTCPVCQEEGMPYSVNLIREHYLFARAAELEDLNRSGNFLTTLRGWIDGAVVFADACRHMDIDIAGQAPPFGGWKRFLDQ